MTTNPLINPEAEQAVLGSLMLDATPAQIHEVRELLPIPECFGAPERRHAFTAITGLLERGIAADPLTVRDELQRLGLPFDVDQIAQFADMAPTAANLVFHAKIVRERWLRRTLASQGEKAKLRAHALDVEINDAFAETVTELVQAAAPALVSAPRPAKAFLWEAMERIEERERKGETLEGLTSGLRDLDRHLGGWMPGRLVIGAARPGVGKTSFAIHAAVAAAAKGKPVYFNSLEMSEPELVERMIAAEAGVSLRRLGVKKLSDQDYTELARAAGFLATLPITLDTTAETPGQLRLALQHFLSLHPEGIGLVVVDYLGLMRWPSKVDNRNDEVGKLTRALKRDVARALNVPVLCLAQLSRKSVETGKPRPPQLADLRDSGNIEQDADQVVMLHYAGHESGLGSTEEWGSSRRTEVYIRKNRHGPGGQFDAYYDRPTGQWNDFVAEPVYDDAPVDQGEREFSR
jgi:replicative DNA helicase